MSRLQQFAFLACSFVAAASPVLVQAQTAPETGEVMWPQEAVAATEAGMKLLEEEKPKEALAKFNEAIAIEGAYPVAYFGKGEALFQMQDYQAAATAYSQAIDRDPNFAPAFNRRGECFLELMQVDLAANDFNNALEKMPSDPKVLSNIGHIMVNYSRGDAAAMATAIRRLDDAIAGNPQDARAYRDRGYANALLRDFKKAEEDLTKAAEIDPADHEHADGEGADVQKALHPGRSAEAQQPADVFAAEQTESACRHDILIVEDETQERGDKRKHG